MKTKFFSAAVIAMAMFATSNVFTSCSKDSDDTVKTQKTVVTQNTNNQSTDTSSKGNTESTETNHVREATTAYVIAVYYFGDDFLKVYDAKFTYTNDDGQQVSENVTESNVSMSFSGGDYGQKFTKKLPYDKFPAQPNFKLEVTPKAGAPAVKGNVGVGVYYRLRVIGAKDTALAGRTFKTNFLSKEGLEAGKNVEFLNEIKSKSQALDEFKLTVAKDGTTTSNHKDDNSGEK